MTAHCPSDLALEVFLLEPARSPLGNHLDACPECAARLARMRAEGEEFRRIVFPQTIEAVENAMAKRRFNWRAILAPAGALAAAAAAVLFVVRPGGPPADYEGVKGSGMGFAVFANGDDPDCAVKEGAKVPAAASLWFKVQPSAQDCVLWVMSVDAKGLVSQLYPAPGTAPARRAAGPLPTGALLDGETGPERVFAVCAPDESMSWDQVKSAAAEVASGGAERVRAVRALGGPLAGAPQASVLLEKSR